MSFAFPSFLWALSVLSIPIIIHLFNFRRTKRIYFSNNRLLKQIKQETTQKRKLKQYLVLASRLSFLLFLVLAFAQPFLPAKEQITSGHQVVIYLDNSLSMSGKVGEKTRALDAGQSIAKEIMQVFPSETRFKIITNDFAPFSNSFKTKNELEDILSQVRLSPISRTFEEIKSRMDADRTNEDIFWISDFQQSTLGKIQAMDSANQWHLVPIEYEKNLSNLFVDSVYRDNPFAISGEKNTITAKIRNVGSTNREDLVVKLIINGIQSATTTFSCEANAAVELSFDLPSGLKKFNEAKFIINDFPVSFDNEFFFTINFGERINIVEIKQEKNVSPIELVFGNTSLFNVKSFLAGNVNYSLIKEADLVVINSLVTIDPALAATLKDYQRAKGSLLLIPNEKPDLNSYQSFVRNNPLSLVQKSEMAELEKPDFQNPFFKNVFEERNNAIGMPKAKRFLNWESDRSAILKFKDGQPYLSQFDKTFLLASPLSKEFTDFQAHALFVPIMYRLAATGKKNIPTLYHSLDDSFITIRADSISADEPIKMVGLQEIVPSQRRNGEAVLLELPRYLVGQGFYSVVHKVDTLDKVALNLDKKESLLKQLTLAEIKTEVGTGKNISFFNSSSSSSFGTEIKERYLGTTLWKQALLLVLLFLLAEVLLIRFLK